MSFHYTGKTLAKTKSRKRATHALATPSPEVPTKVVSNPQILSAPCQEGPPQSDTHGATMALPALRRNKRRRKKRQRKRKKTALSIVDSEWALWWTESKDVENVLYVISSPTTETHDLMDYSFQPQYATNRALKHSSTQALWRRRVWARKHPSIAPFARRPEGPKARRPEGPKPRLPGFRGLAKNGHKSYDHPIRHNARPKRPRTSPTSSRFERLEQGYQLFVCSRF